MGAKVSVTDYQTSNVWCLTKHVMFDAKLGHVFCGVSTLRSNRCITFTTVGSDKAMVGQYIFCTCSDMRFVP